MMPREHDHGDEETALPAGDEAMGDAQAARPGGSDGPEDGAVGGPSGGAPVPRSVQAEPPVADAARTAETRPQGAPPLITAVEIENFKGIGRPVRVELRPITLLFGRNSAGKSTVLHALCYAHEILSHRNVDAHRTDLGGDQIDLGGFRQFVHLHDCTRSVRFRFELKLRNRKLPDLEGWGTQVPVMLPTGDIPLVEDRDILSDAEAGWLELGLEWSGERSEPIVSRYEVGVDGLLLGRITRPAPTGEALLVANLSHPLLEYGIDMQETDTASREIGQVREAGGSAEYGQDLHGMTVLSAPSSAAAVIATDALGYGGRSFRRPGPAFSLPPVGAAAWYRESGARRVGRIQVPSGSSHQNLRIDGLEASRRSTALGVIGVGADTCCSVVDGSLVVLRDATSWPVLVPAFRYARSVGVQPGDLPVHRLGGAASTRVDAARARLQEAGCFGRHRRARFLEVGRRVCGLGAPERCIARIFRRVINVFFSVRRIVSTDSTTPNSERLRRGRPQTQSDDAPFAVEQLEALGQRPPSPARTLPARSVRGFRQSWCGTKSRRQSAGRSTPVRPHRPSRESERGAPSRCCR